MIEHSAILCWAACLMLSTMFIFLGRHSVNLPGVERPKVGEIPFPEDSVFLRRHLAESREDVRAMVQGREEDLRKHLRDIHRLRAEHGAELAQAYASTEQQRQLHEQQRVQHTANLQLCIGMLTDERRDKDEAMAAYDRDINEATRTRTAFQLARDRYINRTNAAEELIERRVREGLEQRGQNIPTALPGRPLTDNERSVMDERLRVSDLEVGRLFNVERAFMNGLATGLGSFKECLLRHCNNDAARTLAEAIELDRFYVTVTEPWTDVLPTLFDQLADVIDTLIPESEETPEPADPCEERLAEARQEAGAVRDVLNARIQELEDLLEAAPSSETTNTLNERIRSQQEELQANTTTMNGLREQILTQQNSLNAAASTESDLSQQLQALQTNVDTQALQLHALRNSLNAATTDGNTQAQQIQALQNSFNAATTHGNTQAQQIQALQNSLNAATTDGNTQAQQIQALQNSLNAATANEGLANTELARLRSDAAIAQAQIPRIQGLERSLATATAAQNNANGEVIRLQGDIDSLTTALEDCRSQRDAKQDQDVPSGGGGGGGGGTGAGGSSGGQDQPPSEAQPDNTAAPPPGPETSTGSSTQTQRGGGTTGNDENMSDTPEDQRGGQELSHPESPTIDLTPANPFGLFQAPGAIQDGSAGEAAATQSNSNILSQGPQANPSTPSSTTRDLEDQCPVCGRPSNEDHAGFCRNRTPSRSPESDDSAVVGSGGSRRASPNLGGSFGGLPAGPPFSSSPAQDDANRCDTCGRLPGQGHDMFCRRDTPSLPSSSPEVASPVTNVPTREPAPLAPICKTCNRPEDTHGYIECPAVCQDCKEYLWTHGTDDYCPGA